jgi:hypothetical protein
MEKQPTALTGAQCGNLASWETCCKGKVAEKAAKTADTPSMCGPKHIRLQEICNSCVAHFSVHDQQACMNW